MNSDIWENPPQPKKIITPDYSFIIECDYWTVSEAVHYLFEAVPGTIEEYHGCYSDFSFAMDLAERAVISRALTVLDEIINEEQPFKLKVTPIVFLVWADSKPLNIPDPLKDLLDNPDRNVEFLSPQNKPEKKPN